MLDSILKLAEYSKGKDSDTFYKINVMLSKHFNYKMKTADEREFINIDLDKLEAQIDPDKVLPNPDITRTILDKE